MHENAAQYTIYTERSVAVSAGGDSMQAATSYGPVHGRTIRQSESSASTAGIPLGTTITQTERVRSVTFGSADDTPQKLRLRQEVQELSDALQYNYYACHEEIHQTKQAMEQQSQILLQEQMYSFETTAQDVRNQCIMGIQSEMHQSSQILAREEHELRHVIDLAETEYAQRNEARHTAEVIEHYRRNLYADFETADQMYNDQSRQIAYETEEVNQLRRQLRHQE